jgi:hypothetical protein
MASNTGKSPSLLSPIGSNMIGHPAACISPICLPANLEAGGRRANVLRRTLLAMAQLAERINAEFVVGQLQQYIQRQLWKDAILKTAHILINDAAPLTDARTINGRSHARPGRSQV